MRNKTARRRYLEAPQMDYSEIRGTEWIGLLAEAWQDSQSGKGRTLAEAIEARIGADNRRVGAAIVEAVEHLGHYVATPADAADTAVELEGEAIAVARRAVRPLLEAKLQGQLDRLDRANRADRSCPRCSRCRCGPPP